MTITPEMTPEKIKTNWVNQFEKRPEVLRLTIEGLLYKKITEAFESDFSEEDQETLDLLEELFEWDENLEIRANITSYANVNLYNLDRETAVSVMEESSYNHASDWGFDGSECEVEDRSLDVTVTNLNLKEKDLSTQIEDAVKEVDMRSVKDAHLFYNKIKPIIDRHNPSLKKVGEESPAWMPYSEFAEKLTKDITAKLIGEEL